MRVRFRVLTPGHTDRIKGHTAGTLFPIPQLDKMPIQPIKNVYSYKHIKLILDPAYVLCFSQTAVSDVRMDDK